MKLRMKDVRKLIRETLDSMEPKHFDPKYWGIADTDVSRIALRSFLERWSQLIKTGPNETDASIAEHILFVDDFEGMGIREAIENGDLSLANTLAQEVMRSQPPKHYNPFANDFHGTDPKLSGNKS